MREPTITIRASNPNAAEAVRCLASLKSIDELRTGKDKGGAKALLKLAMEMEAWRSRGVARRQWKVSPAMSSLIMFVVMVLAGFWGWP